MRAPIFLNVRVKILSAILKFDLHLKILGKTGQVRTFIKFLGYKWALSNWRALRCYFANTSAEIAFSECQKQRFANESLRKCTMGKSD